MKHFFKCVLQLATTPAIRDDPCNPSPCGSNAICNNGQCRCAAEFQGDPYVECRPECILNTECPRNRACIRNKCQDPCPGVCGINAICEVNNHVPMCRCPDGMTGNAFFECQQQRIEVAQNPCQPSPCGPNSQCRVQQNTAVCSCLPNFLGSPPQCRPECITNSDCAADRACQNMKCIDPCPGSCGFNALCRVFNHSPLCSCPERMTGNPFVSCSEISKKNLADFTTKTKSYHLLVEPLRDVTPSNPCVPNPCGLFSECRVSGQSPSCSCLPNYLGAPPNCHPECISNSECPSHQACINQKCQDPCPGLCGLNANCRVFSHTPSCMCLSGFTGDPFAQCNPVQQAPVEVVQPCNPSPCGVNAVCQQRGEAGSCVCLSEFYGNPYEGCRPECVINSDCPSNQACHNNKCTDPCPGTCGQNALCQVINHLATCNCLSGFTGDPYRYCNVIQSERKKCNTLRFYLE